MDFRLSLDVYHVKARTMGRKGRAVREALGTAARFCLSFRRIVKKTFREGVTGSEGLEYRGAGPDQRCDQGQLGRETGASGPGRVVIRPAGPPPRAHAIAAVRAAVWRSLSSPPTQGGLVLTHARRPRPHPRKAASSSPRSTAVRPAGSGARRDDRPRRRAARRTLTLVPQLQRWRQNLDPGREQSRQMPSSSGPLRGADDWRGLLHGHRNHKRSPPFIRSLSGETRMNVEKACTSADKTLHYPR
jgi:hypothetical protein